MQKKSLLVYHEKHPSYIAIKENRNVILVKLFPSGDGGDQTQS